MPATCWGVTATTILRGEGSRKALDTTMLGTPPKKATNLQENAKDLQSQANCLCGSCGFPGPVPDTIRTLSGHYFQHYPHTIRTLFSMGKTIRTLSGHYSRSRTPGHYPDTIRFAGLFCLDLQICVFFCFSLANLQRICFLACGFAAPEVGNHAPSNRHTR